MTWLGFYRKLARLPLVAVFMAVLAIQPAMAMNTLCEPLLRLEQAASAAKKSTVHFVKNFMSGRWKWSPDAVEAALKTIPGDSAGRQQWIENFRKRASVGDYRPEEMLAYLQAVSPSTGHDLYTLMTAEDGTPKDGIWIRRKRFWTPSEFLHFNEIVTKSSRLGEVTKLVFPRKITNLDETLVSMVTVLAQIDTSNTNALDVLVSAWSAEQWQDFGAKVFDAIFDLTYKKDPFAIEVANSVFYETRQVIFRDKAAQKEFLIRIVKDIQDPAALKQIQLQFTPIEALAYRQSGLPGLLDELIDEKGKIGAANEFRKMIAATVTFRALSFLSGAFLLGTVGYNFFSHTARGAGSGATISVSSLNPDGKTVAPYYRQDIVKEIEATYQAGSFNPFYPGLLGPDRARPGRKVHPCDPDGKLEKYLKAMTEAEGPEAVKQDPVVRSHLIDEKYGGIKKYGNDPSTGCLDHFVAVFYDAYVQAEESQ